MRAKFINITRQKTAARNETSLQQQLVIGWERTFQMCHIDSSPSIWPYTKHTGETSCWKIKQKIVKALQ